MRKETTARHSTSAVHWEHLEEWVRQQVQQLIQKILEEEVTEFLGRVRCQRRSGVDHREGYRNGYGKPRRLTLGTGTVKLRRPRVRGTEERFESRVLPLFARRTSKVQDLLPSCIYMGWPRETLNWL